MRPPPLFAQGRDWREGASAIKKLDRRVWKDSQNGFEYEPDPRNTGNWHEINPRTREYRDVDPSSGLPVAGREVEWKKLRGV